MIENIKTLWKSLENETKHDVIKAVQDEWDHEEGKYVRQRYFHSLLIPEYKQERVWQILVNALKLQEEKKKDLLKELGI